MVVSQLEDKDIAQRVRHILAVHDVVDVVNVVEVDDLDAFGERITRDVHR